MIRFSLLMLGLLPLLSGCSWMTLFAVTNRSDEPVVLQYVIYDSFPCPDDTHILRPRISNEGPRVNRVWELPLAQYSCDPTTSTVTVTLPPAKTTYLFVKINYIDTDGLPGVTFLKPSLILNNNEHSPANQAYYTYKKVSKMLYVITYP
ncbi:MAG: hypothetical protein PHD54_12470 [Desulfuromonadaceae bacterium]|nr:hypothetical protein [Desulfuromonadaceae bacterium]